MRHFVLMGSIGMMSAAGCTFLGSFDGTYVLDESQETNSSGDLGSGGHGADDSEGQGAGSEGACEQTCITGLCEDDICTPWLEAFGGDGHIEVRFVAAAPDGTVVIAGDYDYELSIGDHTVSSAGERDMFVAAFERDGDPMWTKSIGGPWSDEPVGLAVDDQGDIFVTLRCDHTSFPSVGTLGTAGMEDICVTRLSPGGDVAWAVSFGSPQWESPWGIATNRDGVFVVGEFDTSIVMGAQTLYAATIGGFVTRLDKTTGQPDWARAIDSPSRSVVSAIAADTSDEIAIAGEFADSVDVGGVLLDDDDASMDLFVARLDSSDGSAHWAKRLHNAPHQMGYAYATAVVNVGPDVVVAGGFDGIWDFGNGPVSAIGMAGFVSRQGKNTGGVWHHEMTGAMFSEIIGIASTREGDVVVSGMFDGAIAQLGGHDLGSHEPFAINAFVAHIGPEGGVDGAFALGGFGSEQLAPPHIHASTGNLLLAGTFDGTLELGPNVEAASTLDGFVMSYGEF